jgi:predicted DCC family thiol-disulfide oxidoreductase YuxK
MLGHIPIQILYDGNCPICCRKVDFLRCRDPQSKLSFLNIRNPDFHPEETGIPRVELENKIHAILPDGTIIQRMDVIRAAYREIELGWLVAPTGWPVFRPLFDKLYDLVAKNRQRISHWLR